MFLCCRALWSIIALLSRCRFKHCRASLLSPGFSTLAACFSIACFVWYCRIATAFGLVSRFVYVNICHLQICWASGALSSSTRQLLSSSISRREHIVSVWSFLSVSSSSFAHLLCSGFLGFQAFKDADRSCTVLHCVMVVVWHYVSECCVCIFCSQGNHLWRKARKFLLYFRYFHALLSYWAYWNLQVRVSVTLHVSVNKKLTFSSISLTRQ